MPPKLGECYCYASHSFVNGAKISSGSRLTLKTRTGGCVPQYLTVVAPSSDKITMLSHCLRGLVQDCPISHIPSQQYNVMYVVVGMLYTLVPIPRWFSHGPPVCRHTGFGRRALRTFPVFDTVLHGLSSQISLVALTTARHW